MKTYKQIQENLTQNIEDKIGKVFKIHERLWFRHRDDARHNVVIRSDKATEDNRIFYEANDIIKRSSKTSKQLEGLRIVKGVLQDLDDSRMFRLAFFLSDLSLLSVKISPEAHWPGFNPKKEIEKDIKKLLKSLQGVSISGFRTEFSRDSKSGDAVSKVVFNPSNVFEYHHKGYNSHQGNKNIRTIEVNVMVWSPDEYKEIVSFSGHDKILVKRMSK